MRVSVALAQVQPATLDTTATLRAVDDCLERAVNPGARLVVFPGITGPLPGPSSSHLGTTVHIHQPEGMAG